MMLNMPQFNPNVQPGALLDDCDRASSVVGFNINQYLEGDSFNKKENQNAPKTTEAPKNPVPSVGNKKANPIFGALALLGIGAGTLFALSKTKKLPFKMPDLAPIKAKFTNFIQKFKKTAPTP